LLLSKPHTARRGGGEKPNQGGDEEGKAGDGTILERSVRAECPPGQGKIVAAAPVRAWPCVPRGVRPLLRWMRGWA
jgi:hypothetical protein